ncbi:MAG: HK97 family phage prohead protease [Holosporaceae bacterium]|jgi:HK97 family phage prohead protease|nr:HK97 family phage prohead protease [Holosporaceae bacterium]
MEFLTQKLQLKSLGENGEISGYASVFNRVDGHQDNLQRGAFKNSLDRFKSGKKPKLLWQHDANFPIGVITDLREDDYGLLTTARLLFDIPKAREVYLLLKNKALDGFSIGYRIRDGYHNNGVHYLTDVDLVEISIVTFPACEEAVVDGLKRMDDGNLSDAICATLLKNISQKLDNFMKGII